MGDQPFTETQIPQTKKISSLRQEEGIYYEILRCVPHRQEAPLSLAGE